MDTSGGLDYRERGIGEEKKKGTTSRVPSQKARHKVNREEEEDINTRHSEKLNNLRHHMVAINLITLIYLHLYVTLANQTSGLRVAVRAVQLAFL